VHKKEGWLGYLAYSIYNILEVILLAGRLASLRCQLEF